MIPLLALSSALANLQQVADIRVRQGREICSQMVQLVTTS
jgi:hypothetical protein